MPAQYAPEYRLTINGAPQPPAVRGSVIRLSHQDGIVGSDRVELTLANPNLRWLDDPLFRVDNSVTLALGYADRPLEHVFVGEITGVTPSFPSGGMPTLTVIAHDFLERLTAGTKYRAFQLSLPELSLPAAGKFAAVWSTSLPVLSPKKSRVSSVRVPR